MDDVEEEEEEEDVEPEKRWEMERENIAMANMSAKLLVRTTGAHSLQCCSTFGATV